MNKIIQSLAIAVAVFAGNTLTKAANITVKGSDTMVILAQKWAEVYMASHPGVSIQVTGGGTGTGFAALQNQDTDICDASRKIKPAEVVNCIKSFKKKPAEYKVCLDGLAVYVAEGNRVSELSLQQISDIFTGKTKNWSEVGGNDAPITIYSRENNSGTYEFFKDHVLKGQDFAATAQTMPGTAALLQAVGKDPNGIGYGGIAYGGGAKHLSIKKDAQSPAVAPTDENVLNQTYPIWRYLYIYLNPALDKGAIKEYIKWMRSKEGQDVVKQVGYFPLPESEKN